MWSMVRKKLSQGTEPLRLRPKTGSKTMNRDEVYREIEDMFGLVPSFSKRFPMRHLSSNGSFSSVQFDEGAIPNKYRDS